MFSELTRFSRSRIKSNALVIKSWEEYLEKSRVSFFHKYNQISHGEDKGVAIEQFEVIRTVGTGWYGRVVLAKRRDMNTFHAVKIVDRTSAVRLGQVQHLFNERRILQAVDFPFFIRLEFYFKDNTNLYFVMPFIVGGELFTYLRREGRFPEKCARFFAGQVILALEYLHNADVVYRDLKPENVLLTGDGYIRITDFGFSKMLKGRTYTICGTPEYLAPEMVNSFGYMYSVDWWSLGVLIYEMCAGYSPFYSNNPISESLLERISKGAFTFPAYFSKSLKEVLKGLMDVEPGRRLKAGRLKDCEWFSSLSWLALVNKEIPAPIIPTFKHEYDPSNYDTFDEVPIHIHAQEQFSELFADF